MVGLDVNLGKIPQPPPQPLIDVNDSEVLAAWIEHVGMLYQLESQLINVAVGVAAFSTPALLAITINLPTSGPDANIIYLGAPIVPLIVLYLLSFILFNSRNAGKYTRSVERQIAAAYDRALTEEAAKQIKPPKDVVWGPALSRLNGALYGGESRSLFPMRLFFLFLAFTVVGISAAVSIYPLTKATADNTRLLAIIFYTLGWIVLLSAYGVGISHNTLELLLHDVRSRDKRKTSSALPRPMSWPAFLKFLLFPRFASLLKGVDAIVILLVIIFFDCSGAFATAHSLTWQDFAHVIWGILFFELVLYQTRYLLNGLREDRTLRSQLPSDRRNDAIEPFSPEQLLTGPVMVVARLLLFYWLVVSYAGLDMWTTVAAIGGFLVAYLVYEWPRDQARRRLRAILAKYGKTSSSMSRAISGEMQVDLGNALNQPTWVGVWLFLASGLGYALRAAFVIVLAWPQMFWTWAGLAIVLTAYLTKLCGVGVGWIVEFTGGLKRPVFSGDPRVGAAQRRRCQSARLHMALPSKPHLLWAAKQCRDFAPERRNWIFMEFDSRASQEDRRVGWEVTHSRLLAPWRITACLALIVPILAVLSTEIRKDVVALAMAPLFGLALARLTLPAFGRRALKPSPWTLLTTGLCALVGSLIVVSEAPLQWLGSLTFIIALTLLPVWTAFTVLMSAGGRLTDMIRQAQTALSNLLKYSYYFVFNLPIALIFGQPVAGALQRRFREDDA